MEDLRKKDIEKLRNFITEKSDNGGLAIFGGFLEDVGPKIFGFESANKEEYWEFICEVMAEELQKKLKISINDLSRKEIKLIGKQFFKIIKCVNVEFDGDNRISGPYKNENNKCDLWLEQLEEIDNVEEIYVNHKPYKVRKR